MTRKRVVWTLKNGATIEFTGPFIDAELEAVDGCPVDQEWLAQNTVPGFPWYDPRKSN